MLDHASSHATSVFNLRPTISAAVLDEGAVLLDLESKYFYALNSSAWAIAQLFESRATIAAVTRQAVAWGAPDADEIVSFVSRLQSYGLLEISPLPAQEDAVLLTSSWTAPTIEQQAEPLQTVMVSAFDPSIPLAE